MTGKEIVFNQFVWQIARETGFLPSFIQLLTTTLVISNEIIMHLETEQWKKIFKVVQIRNKI